MLRVAIEGMHTGVSNHSELYVWLGIAWWMIVAEKTPNIYIMWSNKFDWKSRRCVLNTNLLNLTFQYKSQGIDWI